MLVVTNAGLNGGAEICSFRMVKDSLNEVVVISSTASCQNLGLSIENNIQFGCFVCVGSLVRAPWLLPKLIYFNLMLYVKFFFVKEVLYVNTLSPLLFFMGFLLPRATKIFWLHDDYSMQSAKRKALIHVGSAFSNRIVCPSVFSRNRLLEGVGQNVGRKVFVVYNSVDAGEVKKMRSMPQINSMKVCNVGRIEKKKNQKLFIDYCSALGVRKAYLCGSIEDFDYLDDLMSHAKGIGMTLVVTQKRLAEMPSFYSDMDVLIHTSIQECLPTVLIESFLYGCTAFSVDVGGAREVLQSDFIISEGRVDDQSVKKIFETIASANIVECQQKLIVDRFTGEKKIFDVLARDVV